MLKISVSHTFSKELTQQQQCIEMKKGNATTVKQLEHLPRISHIFYDKKMKPL